MARFALVMILAPLAGLVGCGGQPQGQWDYAVNAVELEQVGMAYRWQNKVPLADGERVTEIWHLDENVYCLTSTHRVLAFAALTGQLRWSEEIAKPGQTVFRPCHIDGAMLPPVLGSPAAMRKQHDRKPYDLVVFSTLTEATMYERDTGDFVTRIDFTRAEFAANTPTASDGERLYVSSVSGRVFALELETGLAVWHQRTGSMISATPEVMSDRLYVASTDGGLHAIEIGSERGEKLWPAPGQHQAGGPFLSDIVVNEQGIFAGNGDYNVYAIDPISGRVIWRFRCGRPVRHAVQVGADTVYAWAQGDAFYAIDLATGQRARWTLPDGRRVLCEIGDTAYVLGKRNTLMEVDATLGTVRTVIPLSGLDLFVPNVTTPAIYAAGTDGLVCCLRPVDSDR